VSERRRGIWVRVVVDVMSGDGIAKDATGSINVELFSLRGEPIKKACEKCSKYYFRYKNIEPNGEMAPAFEIEEHDRNTAVSGTTATLASGLQYASRMVGFLFSH
jgi:hypothetical protein